ncbi:hypothetical protein [Streptomyces brasiliscabiei]|uniref:hypothetical protein n=1 Tax=Streptomyces brasiliscabiei TaxID=2736302 RepID=UPI001C114333|nr:hypothetical protein [Streptomyces brasiliscabiei]
MSEQTTNPGDAHDLRRLLEAVLEAVTLPYDTGDHARRMEIRADWVRATLKGALEEDPANIGWNIDFLRSRLRVEEAEAADRAVRRSVDRAFPVVAQFLAEERATATSDQCARCRKRFDSTDTRFDGRARYRETPHCRACVDNCHEGSAEHVCVICDPKRYGGEVR